MKISACLIVLNEEKNLARCLRSIAPVVDDIVIVDSGSTDRTLEIARSFQARIVEQPWLGYVGQKNFALDQAVHPWVLSIDADEDSADRRGHRPAARDPTAIARQFIVFAGFVGWSCSTVQMPIILAKNTVYTRKIMSCARNFTT